MADLPFPPLELANRVGALSEVDFEADYLRIGAACKKMIVEALPPGWTWTRKQIFDFGCGAGRTLRHFEAEASQTAAFWGCDIDEPSITWAERNLSPPFRVFQSDHAPPVSIDSGTIDLAYALSVFTHLSAESTPWLLELHRLLAEDGVVIATFLGQAMSPVIAGEEWDERRIGRNALHVGQSWDHGGPNVLMSPWWIQAHWGRAFEILSIADAQERDESGRLIPAQGSVVMRKRAGSFTVEDIDAPEPDEPREWLAATHNVSQLHRETAGLREQLRAAEHRLAESHAELGASQADAAETKRTIDVIRHSNSWRLTSPLRAIAAKRRP